MGLLPTRRRPTKVLIINSLENNFGLVPSVDGGVPTPAQINPPSTLVLHAFRFCPCHYGMNIEWFGIHQKKSSSSRELIDPYVAWLAYLVGHRLVHQRTMTIIIIIIIWCVARRQLEWYHLLAWKLIGWTASVVVLDSQILAELSSSNHQPAAAANPVWAVIVAQENK